MYYLDRIKETFNASAFGISIKFYSISKVSLLVSTIIFSVSTLILHVLGNETTLFELTREVYAIEYVLAGLLDMFWGIFLTILFFE